MWRRATVLCFMQIFAACNNSLAPYEKFVDLRVLAMQAKPPELLLNAPGPLTVSVSALVVDPRGGELRYEWSLCPIESTQACYDFDVALERETRANQDLLRRLHAIRVSGTVIPQASDAANPAYYDIPAFAVSDAALQQYGSDITADLFSYFFAKNLLNQGQGAWPTAILTLTAPNGDTLVAAKRIVLGIEDYGVIAAPLLQAYGLQLCPPPDQVQPAGCITLPIRTANTNPEFAGLDISEPSVGSAFNAAQMTEAVVAGAATRLRPRFTDASFETYQRLRGTLQSRDVPVQSVREELSVSWFCSAGTFTHALTWPKFTKNLENVYTAPDAPPSGTAGIVTLWLVGRDQRGGEAWINQQIRVVAK